MAHFKNDLMSEKMLFISPLVHIFLEWLNESLCLHTFTTMAKGDVTAVRNPLRWYVEEKSYLSAYFFRQQALLTIDSLELRPRGPTCK